MGKPPRMKLNGNGRNARARRLVVEALEARRLLATFTVTNTGDNGGVDPAPNAGTGTLRQAIVDANATAGTNQIVFHIGTGLQMIIAQKLERATMHGIGSGFRLGADNRCR